MIDGIVAPDYSSCSTSSPATVISTVVYCWSKDILQKTHPLWNGLGLRGRTHWSGTIYDSWNTNYYVSFPVRYFDKDLKLTTTNIHYFDI